MVRVEERGVAVIAGAMASGRAPKAAESTIAGAETHSAHSAETHSAPDSQRAGLEGVAGVERASLHAGFEPMNTLRRRPVRPAFWADRATGVLLQLVVTNGGGGRQRFFDVSGLEQLALLVGVVAPNARITIRLQFLSHRKLIGFGFTGS